MANPHYLIVLFCNELVEAPLYVYEMIQYHCVSLSGVKNIPLRICTVFSKSYF